MTPTQPPGTKGSVLIVDDDAQICRVFGTVLEADGYRVDSAGDGMAALEKAKTFHDVIVSDIAMPGLDGVALLKQVRARDPDVPLIFITGQPQLETAVEAVELGAFKYLLKPISLARLRESVADAVERHRERRLRRRASAVLDELKMQVEDKVLLQAQFEVALQSLTLVHQPIVSWSGRSTIAYECLLRTHTDVFRTPEQFLGAAEHLGLLPGLGRRVRGLSAAPLLEDAVPSLFVNLHPLDLLDEELYEPSAPLSRVAPRVVLEVTERSGLETLVDLAPRVARLRELGFRVALDDLGAGYAGLNAFASIDPDFVKLDRELVREVDRQPRKLRLVSSLASLCRDLNIRFIAEGVETREERDALLGCGCDLFQGFFFARPGPGFPSVSW